MKILFLIPVVGQPRYSKRIDMLLAEGVDCRAVAFQREYHKGRVPSVPVNYLGKIENARYLKRIPVLIASVPIMRKHVQQADAIYTFSGDSAWLGLIASIGLKKKLHILEVGDVRHLQTRAGPVGKAYRLIDRILTNRIQLLVVTAEDFLNEYYRKWLRSKTPGIVIENKLEPSYLDSISPSLITPSEKERPITIGYFGLMQSPWSWRVLKKIARDNPETFAVILAGYPVRFDDIEEVCEQYENISYTGTYRSPEDLEKLYTSVDLAWGCYSPFGVNDWNLMWARPNRFYEACAFHTPLISRKESTDGKYVAEHGIGYVVSDTDDDTAAENIARITRNDINTWRHNMQTLDKSVYCYTNESSLLVGKMRESIDRNN